MRNFLTNVENRTEQFLIGSVKVQITSRVSSSHANKTRGLGNRKTQSIYGLLHEMYDIPYDVTAHTAVSVPFVHVGLSRCKEVQ